MVSTLEGRLVKGFPKFLGTTFFPTICRMSHNSETLLHLRLGLGHPISSVGHPAYETRPPATTTATIRGPRVCAPELCARNVPSLGLRLKVAAQLWPTAFRDAVSTPRSLVVRCAAFLTGGIFGRPCRLVCVIGSVFPKATNPRRARFPELRICKHWNGGEHARASG